MPKDMTLSVSKPQEITYVTNTPRAVLVDTIQRNAPLLANANANANTEGAVPVSEPIKILTPEQNVMEHQGGVVSG